MPLHLLKPGHPGRVGTGRARARGGPRGVALRLAALLLAWPTPQAWAAALTIEVTGIVQVAGEVLVSLCAAAEYANPPCALKALAPVQGGTVQVAFAAVPEGRYAVLVFQDLDGDRILRRGLFGLPSEPVGFGNDAPIRRGPPAFEDAAIDVAAAGAATIAVRLRAGAP